MDTAVYAAVAGTDVGDNPSDVAAVTAAAPATAAAASTMCTRCFALFVRILRHMLGKNKHQFTAASFSLQIHEPVSLEMVIFIMACGMISHT